jgi:5-formyltetrahydrofolate cyclo-ligase
VDFLPQRLPKSALRTLLVQQRQALAPTDWQAKSATICNHIRQSAWFQNARVVLIYLSTRQEPDLRTLWQNDNVPSRIWGIPRCEGQSLVWHQWQPQIPEQLQKGAYGIWEPSATLPALTPDQVDLILVPAVACDHQGMRLGYGGGYYDRLLSESAWANISTVGVVFDFAYLTYLAADSWDVPMQAICTESGFYRC